MTSEGFFLLINSLERYFQSTANKCLKKVDEERKGKKYCGGKQERSVNRNS